MTADLATDNVPVTVRQDTGASGLAGHGACEPGVGPRVPGTFEQMVDQYQHKVFRLAFSMLGDETAAEDAAQEVFLKIWRALPTYRADASPSSWIYTITRNTCLTEIKRRKLRPNVSLDEVAVQSEVDRTASTEPPVDPSGGRADVNALLADLPEHFRRVVTLFYLEQKSYEEVAAMLDLPMGTVKTHLHRAKKELARLGSRRKDDHA